VKDEGASWRSVYDVYVYAHLYAYVYMYWSGDVYEYRYTRLAGWVGGVGLLGRLSLAVPF